ncbi:MAG: 1-deoxy-D-xylulose-5-phosphate reductoisomerase [Bacillota bacterium]
MVKKIAVLGSTGSIGRQTLEVIEELGAGYEVVVLTAGKNERLLGEQVEKFKPELAVLGDGEAAKKLSNRASRVECKVEAGRKGQLTAATWPSADLVVMAQVGFSGFEPLVTALQEGKTIALANKESLVVGGEILKRLGLLEQGKILPVDSEHSAIWQCLGHTPPEQVSRILLTASGGPFYGWNNEDLQAVKPQDALKHPNWKMGGKITIDSATMMNKGLEVIEAMWLFGLSLDQIKVVIHRQSIIHSMVEYIDGSILAQMGMPDMRLPIQYALTYPKRETNRFEKYDPFGKSLDFASPDRDNFPCLDLAFQAARKGGTMTAVLNCANEVAVKYFMDGRIKFTDIPVVIERVMSRHDPVQTPDISDVLEADRWCRRDTETVIGKL